MPRSSEWTLPFRFSNRNNECISQHSQASCIHLGFCNDRLGLRLPTSVRPNDIKISYTFSLRAGIAQCYNTGLRAGWSGFESRRGLGIFLITIQPPIQWVPEAFSWGVKRLGRKTDHSPPSTARAKNAWGYTSTRLMRLHGRDKSSLFPKEISSKILQAFFLPYVLHVPPITSLWLYHLMNNMTEYKLWNSSRYTQ
jgi:hypothetical protein